MTDSSEAADTQHFLLMSDDGTPDELLRRRRDAGGQVRHEGFGWDDHWHPTDTFIEVEYAKEYRELVEVTAERAAEVEAQLRAENAAHGHRRPS